MLVKTLLVFALVVTVQAVAVASEDTRQFSGPPSERVLLKMSKEFVGGEVQVYSANSTLIISQKMKKRKVSIDFSQVMMGEYTVRILKGTQQQEYRFLKK